MRVVIVLALAACGHESHLRGAPGPSAPGPSDRETLLARPPAGEVRSATLGDGWPVWVVRHHDGDITVASAVGPPRRRSGTTLFSGPAPLVRWVPTSRWLVGGDVAYDERGRALGVATYDGCTEACPRLEEVVSDERDLDTFLVRDAFERIAVGARQIAPERPGVSRWVDWDREPHVEHDLERAPGDVVLPGVALADALARPPGTYAVIAAAIVQSTAAPPQVCADGTCVPGLGIPPVSISGLADHAERATMLVRREAEGLAVVATSAND